MGDVEQGEVEVDNGTFTETTSEGYGSRMKNALTGVCIGFLLFFGSIGLLVWNEGRTVKRAKDIDEGRENVMHVSLENINASSMQAGQLIHTAGLLTTVDSLSDPDFGVSTGGGSNNSSSTTTLKLRRSVVMYQYQEHKKPTERKTATGSIEKTTTYSYGQVWSSSLINSNNFKRQEYKNPTSFTFSPNSYVADPIMLGSKIVLSEAVVNRLNWYEPISSVSLDNVPDETLRSQLDVYGSNGFFHSEGNGTISKPRIGDEIITFQGVPADVISIIAKLSDDYRLDSWTTSRQGLLLEVDRGNFTAEEQLQQADEENTTLAWILRFVGFFLMFISILLILQPLATAVDIIPFVGDFLSGGMENCIFPCIAFFIALPTTTFVIALAWMFYRPAIAVPIVVVSGALMVLFTLRARKAHQQQQQQQEEDPIKPEKLPNTYGQSNYSSSQSPPPPPPPAFAPAEPVYDSTDPSEYIATAPTGSFANALDPQQKQSGEQDIVFK